MKARLDKEMPQEKKKRSFIYWFLLLGVLCLSSVAYFKNFNSRYQNLDSIQQQITKSTNPHTASLNNSAYSQNTHNAQISANTLKNEVKNFSLLQAKDAATSGSTSKVEDMNESKKNHSLSLPLAKESNNTFVPSYEKSTNISFADTKKEEVKPQNYEAILSYRLDMIESVVESSNETNKNIEKANPAIEVQDKEEANIEKKEEVNIEKIANRTWNDLSYVNKVSPSLNLVRPQIANETKLFGLYASVGVNSLPFAFKNNIPMVGIRSSVGLIKNLKLSTGLLYGRSIQDSIQFLYDYRATNFAENAVTLPDPSVSNYVNLKNIQIYKYSTLAIPILAEYRITKNLWIRGGVSYHINKAEKVEYELEQKSAWANYDKSLDNLVSINLVKNHFTWQGGLGLDVSKRLSFSLDLLGRSDFIKSINKSNSPQVQVFASYKIL